MIGCWMEAPDSTRKKLSWVQVAAQSKLLNPRRFAYKRRRVDPLSLLMQLQRKWLSCVVETRIYVLQSKALINALLSSELGNCLQVLMWKLMCQSVSPPYQRRPPIASALNSLKGFVSHQVHEQVREEPEKQKSECNVRVGGLSDNWNEGPVTDSEEAAALDRAVPSLSWLPCHIIQHVRNMQVAMKVTSKSNRDTFFKQSSRLKGTSLWISEDLRPPKLICDFKGPKKI